MASTWGKVLDQASIMLSRQDLEKACIKATRHDNVVPKEKHVRRLIICSQDRADQIYTHLAERLELPDWIVVLKTLAVYHRLFRDGSPRFLADLKWKGTIFPMSKFNDQTSAEAHAQSVFIRKYALYLEEKVLVYRALRMEFEKDPSLLKNLSVEESFVRLPKLQRQLEALINCQTSAEAITNPLTALAFEMLLKDSFKLYRGLNDGIITLLEKYFTMDKSLALTALEIYKAFMRETSSIIAMYEMAKKKFTLELPDLKHAPTTLVNSLEDYIRDQDDGGHRNDDRRRSQSPVPPKASSPHVGSHHNSHHHSPQAYNNAPSLIDPFGVTDLISQPQPTSQPAQPNLFDPFGDVAPQQQPARQNSQYIASPPQAQFARQPSQSIPPPSFNADPFAAPAPAYPNQNAFPQLQPQTQAQSAYEQKAQQIKAAFTPTLQPTAPTSPTINSTPQNPAMSYPKANYNVNLAGPGQPVYGAPQYGSNAMAVYNPTGPIAPSGGQFNPFGVPPANNSFNAPPGTFQPQYQQPQQQQSSNPFL